MKKTFKLLTFTLLLIIVHSACSKNFKDEGNITDDNTDEKVDTSEIDTSLIDFNNIILIYQPLPVIQKCVEGKWRYLHNGVTTDRSNYAYDGEYMILTNERIITGNNTNGVLSDSPVTWEYNSYLGYLLYFDNEVMIKSNQYWGHHRLQPTQILDGMLIFWDLTTSDNNHYFYTKYE